MEVSNKRGRPRKYATQEESKTVQIKQILKKYHKSREGKENLQRGRKPKFQTLEEYREAERQRGRARYAKKKENKQVNQKNE
jgi:hypothetical protein